MREILKTEETYVNGLRLVQELYLPALTTAPPKPLISDTARDEIFLNSAELCVPSPTQSVGRIARACAHGTHTRIRTRAHGTRADAAAAALLASASCPTTGTRCTRASCTNWTS